MNKGKIKSIVLLTIITVLVALLAFVTFASFPIAGYKNGTYDFTSIIDKIGQGDGLSQEFNDGVYFKLTPKEEDAYADAEVTQSEIVETIKTRLTELGFGEAVITPYGNDSIGIAIKSSETATTAVKSAAAYGEVTFKDSDGNVILESEHIKTAYAKEVETSIYVIVELTTTGKTLLAANVDGTKKIGIYLGDTVLLTPAADIPTDGTIYISGMTSMDTAKQQALQIRSGGIAVEFDISDAAAITPSYGKAQMTVIALVVALAVLLIVAIAFYRGFAIATDLAILAELLLTLFFIAVIPGITISVGGIVGLIAGVVLACEGSVMLMRGIKKEYANGKTLRAAVKQTYEKATFVMLDVTAVTGVAAFLMFFICTGALKSFAITFGISVIVGALVNQLLFRLLIKLLLPLPKNEEKFFNLKKGEGEINA